jgi:hypothetical protein
MDPPEKAGSGVARKLFADAKKLDEDFDDEWGYGILSSFQLFPPPL